jgi:hypothetical protein
MPLRLLLRQPCRRTWPLQRVQLRLPQRVDVADVAAEVAEVQRQLLLTMPLLVVERRVWAD